MILTAYIRIGFPPFKPWHTAMTWSEWYGGWGKSSNTVVMLLDGKINQYIVHNLPVLGHWRSISQALKKKKGTKIMVQRDKLARNWP